MSTDTKLGIGALARATGIHTNTIRTWERRYGVPRAERTAGGQRCYTQETVVHLALVKKALDLGHRPATALAMDVDVLRELLDTTGGRPVAPDSVSGTQVNTWIQATTQLNTDALDRLLEQGLAEQGILPFLEELVAPYVVALGQAWADGELTIYHEHFGSARLVSFLSGHWHRLSQQALGPTAVMACLPGERHAVGLHMASWVMARRGWRVVFLGADCPVDDILKAAAQTKAKVIGISMSAVADVELGRSHVQSLLDSGQTASVLLGGAGAFDHPRVFAFQTLSQLDGWASSNR